METETKLTVPKRRGPKKNTEWIDTLYEYRALGYQDWEIAGKFGIGCETLHKKMRNNGIEPDEMLSAIHYDIKEKRRVRNGRRKC
jgi:hypothetical protein